MEKIDQPQKPANIINPEIHRFGIGRTVIGSWQSDLSQAMQGELPEGQLFIPRVDPGVSYVSGHKIASTKQFEKHINHNPEKVIKAFAYLLNTQGILKASAQQHLAFPMQRTVVSNEPNNRDQHEVYAYIDDVEEPSYPSKRCLYGEKTSIEQALFGEIRTPESRNKRAKVVLGAIAVDQASDLGKAREILGQVVPQEITLRPVGPMTYDYGNAAQSS